MRRRWPAVHALARGFVQNRMIPGSRDTVGCAVAYREEVRIRQCEGSGGPRHRPRSSTKVGGQWRVRQARRARLGCTGEDPVVRRGVASRSPLRFFEPGACRRRHLRSTAVARAVLEQQQSPARSSSRLSLLPKRFRGVEVWLGVTAAYVGRSGSKSLSHCARKRFSTSHDL